MKLTLRLAICLLLGISLSRGFSEESPPSYIFELSDEPVKVPYIPPQPKSVFSPELSGGTTPQALEPEAPDPATDISPLEQPPGDYTIRMNSDETQEEDAIQGYEFYKMPVDKNVVITTESPDPAIWLNDGDTDSPFFRGSGEAALGSAQTGGRNDRDTPAIPALPDTDIQLPPFDPTAPLTPDSDQWSPLPWNTGE